MGLKSKKGQCKLCLNIDDVYCNKSFLKQILVNTTFMLTSTFQFQVLDTLILTNSFDKHVVQNKYGTLHILQSQDG